MPPKATLKDVEIPDTEFDWLVDTPLAPYKLGFVKQAKPSDLRTLKNTLFRDVDPDISRFTSCEARKDTRQERKEKAKERQKEFKAEQASKKRKKEVTEEEKPALRRSPRSLQQSPRSIKRSAPLGGVAGSSNASS